MVIERRIIVGEPTTSAAQRAVVVEHGGAGAGFCAVAMTTGGGGAGFSHPPAACLPRGGAHPGAHPRGPDLHPRVGCAWPGRAATGGASQRLPRVRQHGQGQGVGPLSCGRRPDRHREPGSNGGRGDRTFSTRRGHGASGFDLLRRRVLLARKHASCEHHLCLITCT